MISFPSLFRPLKLYFQLSKSLTPYFNFGPFCHLTQGATLIVLFGATWVLYSQFLSGDHQTW